MNPTNRFLLLFIIVSTILFGCKNNIETPSKVKTVIITKNSLLNFEIFKEQVSSKIDPAPKDQELQEEKDSKISNEENDTTLIEVKVEGQISKSHGNVYILWGNLREDMEQHEWNEFFLITRYLAKRGYKIYLNPYAKVSDLEEALQDKDAEMVTWSSHGNGGILHDKNLNPLPSDVFNVNNPRIKQIIISACDGDLIRNHYEFNPQNKIVTWVGTTNSDDFINYFNTDDWLSDFN